MVHNLIIFQIQSPVENNSHKATIWFTDLLRSRLKIVQDITGLLKTLHGLSFQKGNNMTDKMHSNFCAETPDKNCEHEGNKEHIVMILDYPPLILKNSHLQGKIFQVFYKV